ncbi:MAG: efflux RND transporter permease subunit [Burkholderiales bacterium]|nr:efflux RND transporter permease subunit [Burkholderiales bacterium]
MFFTRISIANPVLATMMMAALMVLGLFSYQRLRVDQFPDINFPIVVVTTEYPGASPESVETDITRPVEEAVNTVSGIKTLSSRSYEGQSVVIVEFDLTIDPGKAAQDVREKVAIVKVGFRKEVKEPRISRFDPADRPIISLSVAAPGRSARDLTTLADQLIKKRIENVRGVGSVSIVGGVKREVQVLLKPAELEGLGLGVDQVLAALRSENQELPAGAVRSAEREQSVSIRGRVNAVEDFNRIIVARRGGTAVTLREVATVRDGQEEQENLALLDGRRVLAIDVLKAQGQNTIDVADAVKEAVRAMQRELPPDVVVGVIKDASVPIRTSVDNVRRTMLEGAALTILIVFLFLNSWRSTVITGLTLPIAIVATFFFMDLAGVTINMVSLMALSLAVGLLIDDAIVVRENIVRHAAMGKDHRTAAMDGTREIGLAVFATTMSIVAVFLPVGFMGGIIGRFFYSLGITVVASVLVSMFVSFTLDPMLSSVWPDPAAHGPPKGPLGRLLALFDRLVQATARLYQRLLAVSLRHRAATLVAAAAIFAGSFALVPLLGSEFVPQADFSETAVSFQTPVGSSLELTEAKARQVDAALREFPEVLYTYTTINTGNTLGKNVASVYVKLKPRAQRSRSQHVLTQPLRERLARIAGVTVTHVGTVNPVAGTKLLVLSIQGQDLATLDRYTAEARARLAGIPGLVDVDSSQKPDKPTIGVEVRRELASDLGVGVAQIGSALRTLIAGEAVGTWKAPDGENYDVRVRLAAPDRQNAGDLDRIMLQSAHANPDGTPKMVALRQVAEFRATGGASQINRKDLTREVQIDANVYGRSAGDVGRDIQKALDGIDWRPGYRYVMGGSTKDMKESAGYAVTAMVLAIVFIYMILASQFASFLQPVAIMSSLPLTLIGVFATLLMFKSTLNLFSVIGVIMLMGLVTKNAILLIDFVNQARGEGSTREAAILEAAHVRLRPILMTTLAMVFGMLPLALGLSEGSEQRAPMGQAVIGGVITSSILTLVVVPVVYTVLDDIAARFRRGGAAPAAPAAPGGARH